MAIAASFFLLAIAQVYAEEYDGVLHIQSTRSRSEVRAQAVEAAHARNQNADAASSVVASAPTSPRDRATVQAEAVAHAHRPNQNLRVEAFANSRIPSYYDLNKASSQAHVGKGATQQ
ncbi:hypothetical protein QTI66_35820 [Variovorax sp. J22R133]|uniref:hypothetical protein n=1 Tax=Variovorax brevis TaxID=3053503 RepID=UPI002575B8CD|nr:hypothetical protein [Variovorax sp. J22R133]MDM0117487.1 hypothetical protein [Variovorax sp. J22R133]